MNTDTVAIRCIDQKTPRVFGNKLFHFGTIGKVKQKLIDDHLKNPIAKKVFESAFEILEDYGEKEIKKITQKIIDAPQKKRKLKKDKVDKELEMIS